MTNAHVVAGVTEPEIKDGDRTLDAEVVYYNPDLDVAVLDVPDLDAPAIRFDLNGKEKQQGAVLGYPAGRPVRRPAGAHPRRPAAALTRHLRQRHRHPPRLLPARQRSAPATPAARSSRPPAGCSAWSSPRRSATRTPATPSPPTRSAVPPPWGWSRTSGCRAGTAREGCRFPRLTGESCTSGGETSPDKCRFRRPTGESRRRTTRSAAAALEGRRDLLALLDGALRGLDLLDHLDADEAEQAGDQDVERRRRSGSTRPGRGRRSGG